MRGCLYLSIIGLTKWDHFHWGKLVLVAGLLGNLFFPWNSWLELGSQESSDPFLTGWLNWVNPVARGNGSHLFVWLCWQTYTSETIHTNWHACSRVRGRGGEAVNRMAHGAGTCYPTRSGREEWKMVEEADGRKCAKKKRWKEVRQMGATGKKKDKQGEQRGLSCRKGERLTLLGKKLEN